MADPLLLSRKAPETQSSELERLVNGALLREAEERFTQGDRLIDGHWQSKADAPQVMARRRRANSRDWIEGFVLWTCVGLLGLAFVGLTLLLV